MKWPDSNLFKSIQNHSKYRLAGPFHSSIQINNRIRHHNKRRIALSKCESFTCLRRKCMIWCVCFFSLRMRKTKTAQHKWSHARSKDANAIVLLLIRILVNNKFQCRLWLIFINISINTMGIFLLMSSLMSLDKTRVYNWILDQVH